MGFDDTTLSSTLVEELWISPIAVLAVEQKRIFHRLTHAVEEFSVSPVAVLAVEQRLIIQLLAHVVEEFSVFPVSVLAVEQGLIIQLSIGAAMDECVKSNCLSNYYAFFMNEI